MDPYEILGISPSATKEEIKSAYKKLVLVHHPDQKGGSEEKFKEISTAYKTLMAGSGPAAPRDQRKSHHQTWHTYQKESVYEMPEEIKISITLDLEDVINGAHKKYRIRKDVNCPDCLSTTICRACGGTGFISVNPDVPYLDVDDCSSCEGKGYVRKSNGCRACGTTGKINFDETIEVFFRRGSFVGMKYSLSQKGLANKKGIRGDIIVTVGAIKTKGYTISGLDIHTKIKVPFFDLVLGGEIQLKLPDGKSITREIAPGTVPGSMIIVEKEGLPKFMGDMVIRGDFLAEAGVQIPETTELTEDKISKIKAIRDLWNLTMI